MNKNAENEVLEVEETEAEVMTELVFDKPYVFEGRSYDKVDMGNLANITASDMCEANKYVNRMNPTGISVMPEMSLEYALVLCARMTSLPIEFYMGLAPKYAIEVRKRVQYFLFS